jgi:hypothetical protein
MPDELEAMIDPGGVASSISEQLHLEVRAFGPVFLNKIRFGERLSHTWRDAQPVRRSIGRQAVFAERLPGFVNILAKTGLRIRRGVGCNYAKSAGQVISRPACTMTPVPTIATFLISSIFFTTILLVVGTSLRGQQESALRFLDRLPSPQRVLVKSD